MSDNSNANSKPATLPHAASLAKRLNSSGNDNSNTKRFNLRKQLQLSTAKRKHNIKHSPPKAPWTPLSHHTLSAGITLTLKKKNSQVEISELKTTNDPIIYSDSSSSPTNRPSTNLFPFSQKHFSLVTLNGENDNNNNNSKDNENDDDNNGTTGIDSNNGNNEDLSTPLPTLKPPPVTLDSVATPNPPLSPTEEDSIDHPFSDPNQLPTTKPVAGSSFMIKKVCLESPVQHANAQPCHSNSSNSFDNSSELPFSSFKTKLEFALNELGKELKSLSIDESRPFGKQIVKLAQEIGMQRGIGLLQVDK